MPSKNKKSVKICETYNDISELNTFIFMFGDIGASSDLELVSKTSDNGLSYANYDFGYF